jgi:hypothetical protein
LRPGALCVSTRAVGRLTLVRGGVAQSGAVAHGCAAGFGLILDLDPTLSRRS